MRTMTLWQRLFVLALLLGGAWLVVSRIPPLPNADAVDAALPAQPRAGFPAPDFEGQTLDGETVRLADFRGHPVVLNFWATWCGPCRFEMPAIERVAQAYADRGLVVLLINQGESPDAIRAFLQEMGVTQPVVLDNGAIGAKQYRVRGLPTTVFIHPDGMIEDVVVGGPMSEAFLEEKVQSITP